MIVFVGCPCGRGFIMVMHCSMLLQQTGHRDKRNVSGWLAECFHSIVEPNQIRRCGGGELLSVRHNLTGCEKMSRVFWLFEKNDGPWVMNWSFTAYRSP